jgi:hypothetical protein
MLNEYAPSGTAVAVLTIAGSPFQKLEKNRKKSQSINVTISSTVTKL